MPKGGRPKAIKGLDPAPKTPKALAKLISEDGQRLRPLFNLSLVDRTYSGIWGWHLLSDVDARRVLDLMCDMAALTWNEVRQQTSSGHKRHHYQEVSSLCPEARDRVIEQGLDDMSERMFRFRLDGSGRLWGYEIGDGVFHIVWWDPDHKVYPTEPE